MSVTALSAAKYRRQTATGLTTASLIGVAWLATHVYGVFFHPWTVAGWIAAPLLVAVQCWLSVGLFIVAHDCMHGSLAPFRPALNRRIGQVCLFVYAGFSYDRLITKHFDHHRFPGTVQDPDFNDADPHHFWRWYVTFFRRYFGLAPLGWIMLRAVVYFQVFHADFANVMVFWTVPALLSSVQLFYFGTYLPHRHEDDGFADRHNSRSSDFSWLVSLLTCFHFGYHHEHHDAPHVPWWALPRQRPQQRAAADSPLAADGPVARPATAKGLTSRGA